MPGQSEEHIQQVELFEKPERWKRVVLPLEAYELAESYHLGKPTAYYRAEQSPRKTACLFFSLAGVFLGGDFLLAWALILNENVVVTIILLPLLCVPLLLLASLCVRKALIACAAALAYAYFCQQGLIYIERRRRVVLRWEEIEQTEVQYTFWLRRCLVTLGNGQAAMLLNSVGGNLSGQIRRRLLRFRKKHQHSERFHSPPHFQDWLS